MTRAHTLTEERRALFLACLAASKGLIRPACRKSRVNARTFYDWVRRGEGGEEPFATFMLDVEQVRGDAAVRQLNNLEHIAETTTGPQSVQASQILLSALMPGEFGPKAQQQQAQQDDLQRLLDTVQPLMPEQSFNDLLDALREASGFGRMADGQDGGAATVVDVEGVRVEQPDHQQHPVLPAGTERTSG